MSDDLVKRLQDFPTGIYVTSERALRDEIAARIAALEAALKDIARQKKTDELETEADAEYADFEGAYDTMIDLARAALGAA